MKKRKPIKPIKINDPLGEVEEEAAAPDKKAAPKKNRLFFTVCCLAAAVTLTTIVLITVVFTQAIDFMNHRKEKAELSEIKNEAEPVPVSGSEEVTSVLYESPFDAEMRRRNPDYVCWITAEDTAIDYPVVRGPDNEKYLELSFSGEKNVFGALFMDYRCGGEYVPHIIIYGHNSKYKDMFGGLRFFTGADYLNAHPIITLRINDQLYNYEIFSARYTNTADAAYDLNFTEEGSFAAFLDKCGAPPDTKQILTLSTCVSGNDKAERVIVQGALVTN